MARMISEQEKRAKKNAAMRELKIQKLVLSRGLNREQAATVVDALTNAKSLADMPILLRAMGMDDLARQNDDVARGAVRPAMSILTNDLQQNYPDLFSACQRLMLI